MDEVVAQYEDAADQLARIIDRVERGEEVIISRGGWPVAKVVPVPSAVRCPRRGRGVLAGQFGIAADWDSPATNDAIADDFGL